MRLQVLDLGEEVVGDGHLFGLVRLHEEGGEMSTLVPGESVLANVEASRYVA
jgi:hypothetical protein